MCDYQHTPACSKLVSQMVNLLKKHEGFYVDWNEARGKLKSALSLAKIPTNICDSDKLFKSFINEHPDYFILDDDDDINLTEMKHAWPEVILETKAVRHLQEKLQKHTKIKKINIHSHFTSLGDSDLKKFLIGSINNKLISLIIKYHECFTICDDWVSLNSDDSDQIDICGNVVSINKKGKCGFLEANIHEELVKVYFDLQTVFLESSDNLKEHYPKSTKVLFDARLGSFGGQNKWRALFAHSLENQPELKVNASADENLKQDDQMRTKTKEVKEIEKCPKSLDRTDTTAMDDIHEKVSVTSDRMKMIEEKQNQLEKQVENYTIKHEQLSTEINLTNKKMEMNRFEETRVRDEITAMKKQISENERAFQNITNTAIANFVQQFKEMKSLHQHLQNTVSEIERKLQDSKQSRLQLQREVQKTNLDNQHMQSYIWKLEARLKEVEGKVKKPVHGSLFVGDQTVAGIERHLPDIISIILTNASLEEYEAAIKKNENNYNNIYIVVSFRQSDIPEIKPLTSLLKSAKAKASIGVTISSILPKLEADYYNTCIQKINRTLENLCREMGVQFVNNEVNFKNLDGSVKDEYFSEDGETLADTGLRRLLRNMGLASSTEKKHIATLF